MTLFVSRPALSCLIGISSPMAKFKYNPKGIIKKVMVVFEIIIRVTSIYKGFFKTENDEFVLFTLSIKCLQNLADG